MAVYSVYKDSAGSRPGACVRCFALHEQWTVACTMHGVHRLASVHSIVFLHSVLQRVLSSLLLLFIMFDQLTCFLEAPFEVLSH